MLTRDFSALVSEQEGNELELLVLNCFSAETRVVHLTPNRQWPAADSLLGLRLRTESVVEAGQSVCRVTEGSPN